MGAKHWEKKKQWWKRICARQKPSTPKADDTDEAEVNMGRAKIDTSSVHKGTKKVGMYMMYGDGGRGTGSMHITYTACALHACMTQALTGFK